MAAAITGVMETHLLTNNLIFFTPAERDLLQGLRAECKPGRFDAVPPKGVFGLVTLVFAKCVNKLPASAAWTERRGLVCADSAG